MESKVAIVTGGVQGLGASITKLLLNLKYKVVVADIQEEKGKNFVKELQKIYGSEKVLFFKCDVTKITDYTSLFEFTLQEFKKIDVLVNNAGVICEKQPQLLLSINVMGPILGCQTAIKFMGKSNGGAGGMVINTASIAGLIGHPGFPIYVASKHAVVGLTKSYGNQYYFEKEGIIFSALCPSYIETPLLKDLVDHADVINKEDIATHKLLKADDVAQGIKKLLDDKMNGSTLVCTKKDGFFYVGLQDELSGFQLHFSSQKTAN